jgi:hypothetical protein
MYHGKVSNSFRIWFPTPFNLNVLLKSRLWFDEMFQKGRRGLAYASFDCLQEEAVATVSGLRELQTRVVFPTRHEASRLSVALPVVLVRVANQFDGAKQKRGYKSRACAASSPLHASPLIPHRQPRPAFAFADRRHYHCQNQNQSRSPPIRHPLPQATSTEHLPVELSKHNNNNNNRSNDQERTDPRLHRAAAAGT